MQIVTGKLELMHVLISQFTFLFDFEFACKLGQFSSVYTFELKIK